MLGPRFILGNTGRDQAEKPFWISFADLMSALMVLFLVVMSAALLSVTKTLTDKEVQEAQHEKDIGQRRDVDFGHDVGVAAVDLNGTERHD